MIKQQNQQPDYLEEGENINSKMARIKALQSEMPYGRVSQYKHEFQGSVFETFHNVNKLMNADKPPLKAMQQFEGMM